MKILSAQKRKMIFLKYQRLLSQKEWKDTNQCVIIVISNTSDCGSIP